MSSRIISVVWPPPQRPADMHFPMTWECIVTMIKENGRTRKNMYLVNSWLHDAWMQSRREHMLAKVIWNHLHGWMLMVTMEAYITPTVDDCATDRECCVRVLCTSVQIRHVTISISNIFLSINGWLYLFLLHLSWLWQKWLNFSYPCCMGIAMPLMWMSFAPAATFMLLHDILLRKPVGLLFKLFEHCRIRIPLAHANSRHHLNSSPHSVPWGFLWEEGLHLTQI